MDDDPTLDPGLRSWVPVPEGSDFPIQNLPFGVFSRGAEPARAGVAIGDRVLDLARLEGRLPVPPATFSGPTLNRFLELGRDVWRETRRAISRLLTPEGAEEAGGPAALAPSLHPLDDVRLHLPVAVGDYVDFFSSEHHATNAGRILRPGAPPLAENWRHVPVGYHGRSGSIVVSGTPVRRPRGVVQTDDGIGFRPSAKLDVEVEVGFVTGPGNEPGAPIPIEEAEEHVFGICLVNDWSARDIQGFESRPLGPFLGKSFATTVSPWLVDLDALRPFRVPPPRQDPPPPPHLRVEGPTALDLTLQLEIEGTVLSRAEFASMYWTIPQQLAHATSNGAVARPGDLWASGTVSGPVAGSEGCLLELTHDGSRPLRLGDGSIRTYLEDGDVVVVTGRCSAPGRPPIGMGECRGRVLPAEG